jgi:hypothetical protein
MTGSCILVFQVVSAFVVTGENSASAMLDGLPSIGILAEKTAYHLEEAVAALETALSEDEMIYLEELYQPHPILGHS